MVLAGILYNRKKCYAYLIDILRQFGIKFMADKKIIIANWKMQLQVAQALELATELKGLLATSPLLTEKQVVLCPDFLSLTTVAQVFKNSQVALGAQDGFYEEAGAYTGEVSLADLKTSGCQYVILGHSERRALGESDEIINKKVKAALNNGLIPIICVGETFNERKEGQTALVLMNQVHQALKGISLKANDQIIIAYEPVWVIGTGQAISATEAFQAAAVIDQSLLDLFEGGHEESVAIIYGGSVNPSNIKEFSSLQNIRGVLVGGASLNAQNFVELIKNI